MGQQSNIEWTESTWNPVRGCTRVSKGCEHCYAETVAHRFSASGQPYEGLIRVAPNGEARWNGEVQLVEEHLLDPLRWRKPRRVFVNSMSDLFHEKIPDSYIDRVFAVMALAPQHTFQILTKRPERMKEYCGSRNGMGNSHICDAINAVDSRLGNRKGALEMPLPNVWLGVSCEDQATADERIPLLLQTPAALRWVSAEPLQGPIDFTHPVGSIQWIGGQRGHDGRHYGVGTLDCPREMHHHHDDRCERGLDWIVIGGESGAKARPFDVRWAREIIAQCRAASVPVFMKQMGSNAVALGSDTTIFRASALAFDPSPQFWGTRDRKGGDPTEWPEDLRLRQYPHPSAAAIKPQ